MNLKKIKYLRILSKKTCENMAIIIGLDSRKNKNISSTYAKKESGTTKFSLQEAKKLADYFNMSIEELFFEED